MNNKHILMYLMRSMDSFMICSAPCLAHSVGQELVHWAANFGFIGRYLSGSVEIALVGIFCEV